MHLSTAGKPQKIPLALCKKAVLFYGKKLLSERLLTKIEVELVFNDPTIGRDVYGYCDWNDENTRSRDFTITIRPNLSKKKTLLVLAHEMVHVKQYAKGEMKDYMRLKRVKFNGKIYDKSMDYWEHPWEIEAHGREKGLYFKFLDSERLK